MRPLLPSCCLVVALAVGGCGTGGSPAPTDQTDRAAASATSSAAVMAAAPTTFTRSAPKRAFYHESDPYRLQNSVRGLRTAVAEGFAWIDIDSNYCWDDARASLIPLAVHWSRIRGDRFRDPQLQVPDDSPWSTLTLTTARRLRTDDPQPYRVATMIEMVRAADRLGLTGIEWEVKGGAGFESPAIYRPVLKVAAALGVRVVVKTLRNLGGDAPALRRLWAAKKAGATTMLLNHDAKPVPVSAARGTYLDYVRGPWTDVR